MKNVAPAKDLSPSAPLDERAQRLMAMGQMAASLAHEIRNPLGSMELFCSLLKKDLQDQPTLLHMAEQIHLGIRRLEQIIANSLRFSRDIQPRCVLIADVPEFLQTCVGDLRSRLAQVNIDLAVCCECAELYADPGMIRQAIVNLLINALEAVDERQQRAHRADFRGRIELSARAGQDGWKLSVCDNGVGLDESVEQHMFDPFFTTKQEGTGLGLAVVHSLVRAHGGTVSITSNEDGGVTVTINLVDSRS